MNVFLSNLSLTQLVLVFFSALLAGFSKSSIGGLGILLVPLMASVFPAKESTGILLPMLIVADLCAVYYHKQSAQLPILKKIFPMAACGVVLGWIVMRYTPAQNFSYLMGYLLISLLGFEWAQKKWGLVPQENILYSMAFGVLAGIATMIANAAGPLFAVYLLTLGLKKEDFVGTRATFFLLINLFKLPFSAQLGLISGPSLILNSACIPFVLLGAYLGRRFIKNLNPEIFEWIIRIATVLAVFPFFWKN